METTVANRDANISELAELKSQYTDAHNEVNTYRRYKIAMEILGSGFALASIGTYFGILPGDHNPDKVIYSATSVIVLAGATGKWSENEENKARTQQANVLDHAKDLTWPGRKLPGDELAPITSWLIRALPEEDASQLLTAITHPEQQL